MRLLAQLARFLLELGVAVLVFWVVAPENKLLFLVVLGALTALATLIRAARMGPTNVAVEMAAWAVLITALAFARFQIWRPRVQTPSLDQTVSEFVVPSLVVIALAILAGAFAGRAIHAYYHRGRPDSV